MTKQLKLTTRGRYAMMAMVELAKHTDSKPLPLSEIAKNGDISLSYLEQLIAGLRRHGLVKSYRGPGGGYSLTKPMREIFVSEILIAAEDSTPAKRNSINEEGKMNSCAHTNALWEVIGSVLFAALKSVTLEDVLSNKAGAAPTVAKLFEIAR
jgi:Rrf2 family iron-sulfur cluster assembly transcriptional regulator